MIGILQAGAKLEANVSGSVIGDTSRQNIEMICRPTSAKYQDNSPQDAR